MKIPERQFTTVHAAPSARPLWIGLFGPSGGGKTFSALVLATGIQSVLGGKIEMIDTESGRGKHYAEMFDYEYTEFPPPHGSLDYLAAIKHAAEVNKSRIVIIDSFSHEHEGEGGLIEFHEAEVQRLSKGDASKAEQVKMLAWTKPKTARKQLLRSMLAYGTGVTFILCFRADESSKPVKGDDGKTKVMQMGFMPIAGKPFVYEATVCALLMPGANGVPTWNPEYVGEKLMRKLPEQFKAMFEKTQGKPLCEEHGRLMAEWAKGVPASVAGNGKGALTPEQRVRAVTESISRAKSIDALNTISKRADDLRCTLEGAGLGRLLDLLEAAFTERRRELREAADA